MGTWVYIFICVCACKILLSQFKMQIYIFFSFLKKTLFSTMANRYDYVSFSLMRDGVLSTQKNCDFIFTYNIPHITQRPLWPILKVFL